MNQLLATFDETGVGHAVAQGTALDWLKEAGIELIGF